MIYRLICISMLSIGFASIPTEDIARINKDLFSATENNYQDLSIYFTDDAWASFSKALIDSGNLAYIKKYKMSTTVTFLGISESIFEGNEYIIKSNIMVTHHNDQFYHTNEYAVTMVFIDTDKYFKIKQLDVDSIGSAVEGLMAPLCNLK